MNKFIYKAIKGTLVFITTVPFLYSYCDSKGEPPNVIIITLSGINNRDSIDDPLRQYMPNIWKYLKPEGTLYTGLKAEINQIFHMPSTHALSTGLRYLAYGSKIGLAAPTIYQYFGEQYGLEPAKIWSIGHWKDKDIFYGQNMVYPRQISSNTFKISQEAKEVLNRLEMNFFNKMYELRQQGSGWANWDSLGQVTFSIALKVFSRYKPKLVHYIMNSSECAHFGTFGRYVNSLKDADDRIYKIWRMIEEDKGYRGRTYLIVNVDHERDPYYMEHNKLGSDVWMYIYGPTIKKDIVISRGIEHVDIFATLAYILDLKTHSTPGRVLRDCMDGSINIRN